MALPNIKDYVRLHPPFASIDTGRSPVVKWHSTRGAAMVSAQSATWTMRELPRTHESAYQEYEYVAKRDHAVAVVSPNGDLEIVESWASGEVRDR